MLGGLLRTLEEEYFNGRNTLEDCIYEIYDKLKTEGFAASCRGQIPGNYAMVRIQELWAMVNRYRGLVLK